MDLPFDKQEVAMVAAAAEEPPSAAVPHPSSDVATNALAALRHLVVPNALDPALHEGALRIVLPVREDLRQQLLDELSGHLNMPRKTIGNPLGWLRSIARQASQGELILTMAPAVAAARERRRQHEASVAKATHAARVSAGLVVVNAVGAEDASLERKKLVGLRDEIAARAAARRLRAGAPLQPNAKASEDVEPAGHVVATAEATSEVRGWTDCPTSRGACSGTNCPTGNVDAPSCGQGSQK